MAGKRKEITVKCFVLMPDGRTVPVEELTEEERAAWHRRQLERLSETMSDYYTQHPDQYARLCGRLDREAAERAAGTTAAAGDGRNRRHI